MIYRIPHAIVVGALFFMFRIKKVGLENIPKTGPAILAVNHRSDLDPVVVGSVCPRILHFMAKSELFKPFFFGHMIHAFGAFPVKRGTGDLGAIKISFQILSSGKMMLIFPEGGRVKYPHEKKAQQGAIFIAQHEKVPIIPVCISGKYRWMHKITVTFGEPITMEQYYGKRMTSEQLQKEADNLLDKIYENFET